jgi:hypothetical protein
MDAAPPTVLSRDRERVDVVKSYNLFGVQRDEAGIRRWGLTEQAPQK